MVRSTVAEISVCRDLVGDTVLGSVVALDVEPFAGTAAVVKAMLPSGKVSSGWCVVKEAVSVITVAVVVSVLPVAVPVLSITLVEEGSLDSVMP